MSLESVRDINMYILWNFLPIDKVSRLILVQLQPPPTPQVIHMSEHNYSPRLRSSPFLEGRRLRIQQPQDCMNIDMDLSFVS